MMALRSLYRLLLYACPAAVRREYGRDMEEVFLHCVEAERERRGPLGRVLAVWRGSTDLLAFAARAHWNDWGIIERSELHTRSRRPLVLIRDIRGTLRLVRSQPALSVAIVIMLV